MRASGWFRMIAPVLIVVLAGIAHAQSQDPRASVTDSAAAAYRMAIARLTSPAFEQRKAQRLALQRRGYAAMLHRSLAHDAWGAVLALLTMRAQLDFHLPTNTLVTTIAIDQPESVARGPASLTAPAPAKYIQIPLIEDRRFPPDPWHK